MIFRKPLILLSACFLLISCASTDYLRLVSPAYRGKSFYDNLLAIAPFPESIIDFGNSVELKKSFDSLSSKSYGLFIDSMNLSMGQDVWMAASRINAVEPCATFSKVHSFLDDFKNPANCISVSYSEIQDTGTSYVIPAQGLMDTLFSQQPRYVLCFNSIRITESSGVALHYTIKFVFYDYLDKRIVSAGIVTENKTLFINKGYSKVFWGEVMKDIRSLVFKHSPFNPGKSDKSRIGIVAVYSISGWIRKKANVTAGELAIDTGSISVLQGSVDKKKVVSSVKPLIQLMQKELIDTVKKRLDSLVKIKAKVNDDICKDLMGTVTVEGVVSDNMVTKCSVFFQNIQNTAFLEKISKIFAMPSCGVPDRVAHAENAKRIIFPVLFIVAPEEKSSYYDNGLLQMMNRMNMPRFQPPIPHF
jgi:hypothetical protein